MSRISQLLSSAGLGLRKSLGQNFLVNQGALEKIAAASDAHSGSLVVEIGCGLGNLTELLARRAGLVVAVELDERFRSIHERELGALENVRFLYEDFIQLELAKTVQATLDAHPDLEPDVRVVGNIPYHLTSPILFKLLASPAEIALIGLLMQREVAQRLCAQPGSRNYGILAVKAGVRFVPQLAFTISPGSFLPAPKVHSALACLTPRRDGALIADPAERQAFFDFVDAAFAQRRKMLAKSLAATGRLPREATEDALTRLNLDPRSRAEQLAPTQLLALFQALDQPKLPTVRKIATD